jgi:hypothetical protein
LALSGRSVASPALQGGPTDAYRPQLTVDTTAVRQMPDQTSGGVPIMSKPRLLARRSLIAAGAAAALARPAIAQNALKGTKLTILVGQFYVPENNAQLDQLAKDVAADTGMEIHVERLVGDELGVKTAAVIATGRGADLSMRSASSTAVGWMWPRRPAR